MTWSRTNANVGASSLAMRQPVKRNSPAVNTTLSSWLYENAGPILKFHTARDLIPDFPRGQTRYPQTQLDPGSPGSTPAGPRALSPGSGGDACDAPFADGWKGSFPEAAPAKARTKGVSQHFLTK